MAYNDKRETDADGYVLEPNDPRFTSAELYRGTTLGEVDFGERIRATGQKSIAQIWALHYSRNARFSKRTRHDIIQFLADEFGLDENPYTPVVVIVQNAERYVNGLRELDSGIRAECDVNLDSARQNGDVVLEQVTKKERRWLLNHLCDVAKCHMFIPDDW